MVRNTKRNRTNYNKRKIMRGGFTGDEETALLKLGFSQVDIDFLQSLDMNMNLIEMSLNTINQTTGQNWTPQELITDLHNINDGNNDSSINSNNSNHSLLGNSLLSNMSNSNESLNLSNISGVSDHIIYGDSLNLSDDEEILSQDSSLHLSDLQGNSSALTDYPSNNSNNSLNYNNPDYSSILNNSNNSNNSNETTREEIGGKSRKKRAKKSKKSRKTRKSYNKKGKSYNKKGKTRR